MILRSLLVAFAVLLTPLAARADYLDVIVNKLKAGCSIEKYMAGVEEFRGVMKSQGYKYSVEIVLPLMDSNLGVVYWVGRAPDLTAFGEGFTRWNVEIAKKGTPEAKVNDKLAACSENVSRTGSLTR